MGVVDSLRIPLEDKLSLKERPSFLRLYGQESIASLHRQTLVARRWQSVRFKAGTIMEFIPTSHQQMAGLTCFYNTENYMYAYVSYDEDLSCRILDVLVCTKGKTMVKLGEKRVQIPKESNRIRLEVRVDREKLNFFYAFDEEAFLPLADTLSAESLSEDFIRDSALVFTGAMVGMCVQGMLGVVFRFYLFGRSEKNAKMQELLKFSAANKIQKKLEESQSGFVVKKDISTCYAILLLWEEESQAEIETRIRRLVAVASDHQNLSIKVGVGAETEDISNLPLAYKTSRFAMELYYFTEEELIWYQDVKKDFRESFEDYQERFQNLLDACLHHHSSVENELKKIFSVIRNLHFGNRFAALNRCNLMMADLIQTLCEQYLLDISWVQEGESCMEQIRLLPTYRQTCETIRRFFYNMCEQIHLGGSSEHKEIVRIRQYIHQHFGENLTLEWMAQTFGMNSFYFSSYFKKNTGKNFKNYLTDLRMEEAEKLLMHTDYKAYEIAEKIGYKNVRQFNENFSKTYGKSPSEYRKEKTKEK